MKVVLEYFKQLRLNTARNLMASKGEPAAFVARLVGAGIDGIDCHRDRRPALTGGGIGNGRRRRRGIGGWGGGR